MRNLQVSYSLKEIAKYEELLAGDFRFYFSEEARRQNPELPELKWRDLGMLHGNETVPGSSVRATTWSSIKAQQW